ncbi:DUF1491 family protein [Pseudooceanicola sp. 216_PA32_1]|jgi:hypothetical protein|uniref:DUF1491 family protein n=1 Tax=Pseudooceanicola pacificus TaxID=2676438 RepID=A0A844W171_9RHOB|nr:DUF1491 family protein [Pseudooceanicola pacificus]MWB76464.1 DUF1491 family protein [Pseudooceanicola pacificus]
MRLITSIWVSAYLTRLRQENIPAYVIAHGDDTAGAVLVKVSTLDGKAASYTRAFDPGTGQRGWTSLVSGPESEVDAAIHRQRGYDPDLWVIEIEERTGRHLLDEPGISD